MFAMKVALSLLLVVHGLIHLLGFAKGFHLAALPQLTLPISRSSALAWLAAGSLLLLGAGATFVAPRFWGVVVLLALPISQALIIGQFKDAKYGSVLNALLLIPALINTADLRPASLASKYRAAVSELPNVAAHGGALVNEQEVARLPESVRRYLERVGVVGKPRPQNMHVVGHMQMRRSPAEAWMDSRMDQYSSLTDLRRLFFMVSHKGPLSFDVLHQFTNGAARFEARVLGLFPVAMASGAELTQSETVTVLNDLCLLAPAALVDPRLSWEAIDDSRARVWLKHGGHLVSAELHFNANGELTNFISHDRFQSDGKVSQRFRWSTPVTGYRDSDGYHRVSSAEAQWEEPSGLWTYAQFSIERIEYDVLR
jgi:hypothetical protein